MTAGDDSVDVMLYYDSPGVVYTQNGAPDCLQAGYNLTLQQNDSGCDFPDSVSVTTVPGA